MYAVDTMTLTRGLTSVRAEPSCAGRWLYKGYPHARLRYLPSYSTHHVPSQSRRRTIDMLTVPRSPWQEARDGR
jgi:hypothetical protein